MITGPPRSPGTCRFCDSPLDEFRTDTVCSPCARAFEAAALAYREAMAKGARKPHKGQR